MEKSDGGGMRLPIGYRFHPTDEELIVHYLKRKTIGVPLPASVIPELDDFFQHDPWTLPGDLKEKRYFFGRKMGQNICKIKIAAGSGYWKPIGKTKPILTSLNHLIGLKKTLIFCPLKHSTRQWVMQEYRLLGSATVPHKTQVWKPKLGEWVVYGLFQRMRPKKLQKINLKPLNTNARIHSNTMECRVVQECSDAGSFQTCSSGITEVQSTEIDQDEISTFHS